MRTSRRDVSPARYIIRLALLPRDILLDFEAIIAIPTIHIRPPIVPTLSGSAALLKPSTCRNTPAFSVSIDPHLLAPIPPTAAMRPAMMLRGLRGH